MTEPGQGNKNLPNQVEEGRVLYMEDNHEG